MCWPNASAEEHKESCVEVGVCPLGPLRHQLPLGDEYFLSVHLRIERDTGGQWLPSNQRYLMLNRRDLNHPGSIVSSQIIQLIDGHGVSIKLSSLKLDKEDVYLLEYSVGANGDLYRYFTFDENRDPQLKFIGEKGVYGNIGRISEHNSNQFTTGHSMTISNPAGWVVVMDTYELLRWAVRKTSQEFSFYPDGSPREVDHAGADNVFCGAEAVEQGGDSIYRWNGKADEYAQGLIRIVRNGKIGFADRCGKVVIQPQYDWASYFNGVSRVCVDCQVIESQHGPYVKGGRWGEIDPSGNIVRPLVHSSLKDF